MGEENGINPENWLFPVCFFPNGK
jgi:hypothetical protein